tara:strand:- start:301 stop:504 length:204 start_codon:yes stop_codon:yes gene_type:complete
MAEKLWKIQENTTNGWTSIDPKTDNLTKSQCDHWLNEYVDQGTAPNRLRAVPAGTPDDGLEALERRV